VPQLKGRTAQHRLYAPTSAPAVRLSAAGANGGGSRVTAVPQNAGRSLGGDAAMGTLMGPGKTGKHVTKAR
jgi:hypothetical protein